MERLISRSQFRNGYELMGYDLIGMNKKLKKKDTGINLNTPDPPTFMIMYGDEAYHSTSEYLESVHGLEDVDNRISFHVNNQTYRRLMTFCLSHLPFSSNGDSSNEDLFNNDGLFIPKELAELIGNGILELLTKDDIDWKCGGDDDEDEWIRLFKEFSDFCLNSGGYYIY